ncbi:MAG: hypothetical protein ACYSYV_03575 [Planctomycetota bacterium]
MEGRKLIELRLYKTRRGVFGRVWAGDKLFLKVSSGPVCAMATAEAVKNFENLTPEKILELKRLYNRSIGGPDEHWQSKIDCKFGFMVWLKDVRAVEPVRIRKKDWRAWVVLTENNDFGLLRMGGLK